MKVNSVGNTNYSPNFGIKISPKAKKQILKAMERGIVDIDEKIFEKINNIPGECTLVGFSPLVNYNWWFVFLRGTSKKLPLSSVKIDLDRRVSCNTDHIISGIDKGVLHIVKSFMDKQAHKGLLKGKLKVLRGEFPQHGKRIDDIYNEVYKAIDNGYAEVKQDYIARHPFLAKVFGMKCNPVEKEEQKLLTMSVS